MSRVGAGERRQRDDDWGRRLLGVVESGDEETWSSI